MTHFYIRLEAKKLNKYFKPILFTINSRLELIVFIKNKVRKKVNISFVSLENKQIIPNLKSNC